MGKYKKSEQILFPEQRVTSYAAQPRLRTSQNLYLEWIFLDIQNNPFLFVNYSHEANRFGE